MYRCGFVLICMLWMACGDDKKKQGDDETGFSYETFSGRFKTISPPYQLSDTGLLNNRDTASIRNATFIRFLPDSLKNIVIGRGTKPRFIPLAHMNVSDETDLYFVKVQNGNKKVALIYAFDKEQFTAVFPFLVPDNDPTTTQLSVIDKALAITKNITQRRQNTITGEGKEVYDYDPSLRQFTLILTNPLNATAEVINPIDTFTKKHRFAGDYIKNKKNFVSVRDGRYPDQLMVYVHVDKNEGGCTGELKGDLLFTSPTTAVYRQGGDPCVMTFRFSAGSVTVQEKEGCGSHRGIECSFDGSYPRKKEVKPKTPAKKRR